MKHAIEFDVEVPVAGNTEVQLQEWTPQQFAAQFNLVSIDEMIHKTKENNYPFVSFEDVEGNRTHVYLSVGLSEELDTMDDATTAPEILKGKRIQEVINVDGNIRLKLTRGGATKVNLDDMFSGW